MLVKLWPGLTGRVPGIVWQCCWKGIGSRVSRNSFHFNMIFPLWCDRLNCISQSVSQMWYFRSKVAINNPQIRVMGNDLFLVDGIISMERGMHSALMCWTCHRLYSRWSLIWFYSQPNKLFLSCSVLKYWFIAF